MIKSKTPEYRAWQDMLQRCNNPKSQSYKDYGARGVSVCERWLAFDSFIEDMGPRPDGRSLDRINNDGNYEPSNCRWADLTTQNRNTRRSTSRNSGVYFEKASGKWVAGIVVKRRSLRIGTFDSEESAIEARAKAKVEYWDGAKEPPRRGTQKNNRSGYVGVYEYKKYGTWTAYYGSKSNRVHIGSFPSAEQAHAARVNWLTAHGIKQEEA